MSAQLATMLREAVDSRDWDKVARITNDLEFSIPEKGLMWCWGSHHVKCSPSHANCETEPAYFEHRDLFVVDDLEIDSEIAIGRQGQMLDDVSIHVFDFEGGRGTLLVVRP